ncbi:MAG: preprotein translocase subunit SecA [Firmicutes bacterium]|nr:preprotein translocase subunit SecA [Bacillota bacterium]
MGFVKWLAGSDNRRNLKKMTSIANYIESLEEEYKALSDDELRAKTDEFRKRHHESFEPLDKLLPEAFATVREASRRVLNMRHFFVQLIGGICLHQGRIAEMRTGEGKTLVSTLPAYLNAISGKGVHVVTVNDYLARRDAEWMGKVHKFLGLTVGVAVAGMDPETKRAAYNCDITYATNNELGFDYLRDNMVLYKKEKVQRDLNFAIIDEVDSILVDEARTPLIISGRGNKSSDDYKKANQFAKGLVKEEDVDIDEQKKTVHLTDDGIEKAERYFAIENLTDLENTDINHYINNAIRARFIMKRDSDYIVSDGEIIIVDEFTGRLMIGRRYSEGLHQAIEAKEGVRIQSENKTLATITFQNYFRLYGKLSGMTGTAKTEESEFKGIYSLDVVVIPTNKPMERVDENDQIFTTVAGKMRAVVEDAKECYERGQPVLIGTTSVEKSEEVGALLKKAKVPHNVLNAKNHEREAEIVAQAGRAKQITIATNMAGRGTDILLGGNAEYMAKEKLRKEEFTEEEISYTTSLIASDDPKVIEAREKYKKYYAEISKVVAEEKQKVIDVGGLRIIGTERHESRRIDNQLRGRAGRQGDIGSSVFYISMEDDLLRLFGGERMKRWVERFGADEDTPFSLGFFSSSVERAQKKIEGRNYSTRKHVLEYDDVMNKQREIIYKERNKVLNGEDVHDQVVKMMQGQVDLIISEFTDPKTDWNEWDIEGLNKEIERKVLPNDTTFLNEDRLSKWTLEEVKEQTYEAMQAVYNQKIKDATEHSVDFGELERYVMLKVVDELWMDHIDAMDNLKRGIGLKAYGQQDPVQAYKKEGFEMFDTMIARIQESISALLMRAEVGRAAPRHETRKMGPLVMSGGGAATSSASANTAKNREREIGRNEPCPCGSNKKYKNCCLMNKAG